MYEMLGADLIQFAALACVFIGIFLLFSGVSRLLQRGENRSEARNRRLRMIRDGASSEDIFALLRPEIDGGLVARVPLLGKLPKLLAQAGIAMTPQSFLGLCFAAVVVLTCLGALFAPVWQAALLAALVGIGAPVFVVKSRKDERTKQLTEQLPDALELMARGLKIGHPINTSIGAVADEMADPIGSEFGLIFDQVSFGEELPDAVQEFADRIDTEDAHYLAASIAIQHGTGGDLERIVSTLATVIRRRISLRARIKAISAEGRLSGVLLSVIPLVIIGLMSLNAPGYYTEVSDDPAFMKLAILVVVLMISNVVVLHRLVNFRV